MKLISQSITSITKCVNSMSNNMQNDQPKAETSERPSIKVVIARPLQNMHIINKVIRIMFGYRGSIMYKDISAACNMHPVNVSQALSGARDVGLVELAGKKGLYRLTKAGMEYARFLTAGKDREAKDLIRFLLNKNPLWAEIIRFLNVTRGQSRDILDLVLEIERKSGKQWGAAMRKRIGDSISSILEYAGMVTKEGSSIISVVEWDIGREDETELPPELQRLRSEDKEFSILEGDDFTFEVRNDLDAIGFAENQFVAWIRYLKKKLKGDKQEARQSGGVPNQQQ